MKHNLTSSPRPARSLASHRFAARQQRFVQACSQLRPGRGLAALLLLVLLLPLLFDRGVRSAAVSPAATAPLQGEAALTELKQRGQYDSLAQAMRSTRYQVRATDAPATFAAANPAQGYHTTFTPAGVELAAAGGTGWRLGLKLRSVGYGTRQASVSAGELQTQGSRVELRRTVQKMKDESGRLKDGSGTLTSSLIPHPSSLNSSLTEWYENRPAGLEQGFTLSAAPGERQAGEALEVTLQLNHGWQAQVAADAQAATLSSADGQTQLHYEHLVVTDATGRLLAARMIAAGGALRLAVQDAGAQYPVTIDPTITQQAYLKASNTGATDQFGWSVAVAGDTVVVGARQEDSTATGVNGDGTNNSAGASGAAYVFVRSGTTWTQQAYLKASNTGAGDGFGRSVAVAGDTVVVGAAEEGSNATGVNAPLTGGSGTQADNSAINSGAAYVFVRSGTTWTQQAYLKASNTGASDRFGWSVAVAGDTVVVGAYQEDSTATGVNGDGTNNSASTSGAAYVFTVGVSNAPPTITAGATATRQQGSAGSTATIATVGDDLTAAGSIAVTATTVPTGITVTSISNSGGTITATVAADCSATTGNNTVVLTVTDGNGATTTANLIVSVTANAAPTVGTYANTMLLPNGSITVTPNAAPADNGTIATVTATAAPNTFTGTFSGNTTTGAVTITNAAPLGIYTVTVTVTDNCNATTQQTFTLTVGEQPMLKAQVGDPAICLDPGGLVGVQATVTNPNNTAQISSWTATLPAGLTAVAGTCVADVDPGGCVIAGNGGSVTWNGTLAAGQTVNIIYRAQIGANVAQGAQLCIDNAAVVGGIPANLQFCFNVVCPGTSARVSAQKPGSVLVFPYYTSTVNGVSNTRLTISHSGGGTGLTYVHLFLIDGATCQASDFFLCLTPNASLSFKASDYDPGLTGYLLAVAVNAQGVPIRNNVLIGNAFVNTPQFTDTYGAEAFAANSDAVALVANDTAQLFFDHVGYDGVPNQFAVEVQSPLDAPGQQIVTAGLSGDLNASQLSGAEQLGTGLIINGNETPTGSFVGWLNGRCQASALITATTPRVPGGMNTVIPKGQVGTMSFNVGGAVGLLLTPRTAAWHGIRALHKTRIVARTITIPVVAPVC